jgi:hypothetical protein
LLCCRGRAFATPTSPPCPRTNWQTLCSTSKGPAVSRSLLTEKQARPNCISTIAQPPGTVITRLYKGQTLQVEVLPVGFSHQGNLVSLHNQDVCIDDVDATGVFAANDLDYVFGVRHLVQQDRQG